MPTVSLSFSTRDLSRTRFAFSPLFETVMSVRALQDPARYAIHLPWLQETREALAGLDLAPLYALVRPEGYTPDFVAPPPSTPLPEFEEELHQVAASDPLIIRREVARTWADTAPPPAAQRYLQEPQVALTELIETLRAYWQRALAPHWPRLRAVLEGDVLMRARQMALLGPEVMFSRLSHLIHYEGSALTLDEAYCPVLPEHQLQGRGLLLMPSAFVWPRFMTILDPPWQPTLFYTPRGVASLWDAKPPPVGKALELLLGRGRAEVLLSLGAPAATQDLARRLNLAASSVSEHLSVLRQAGLLDTSRQGRAVYYRLSPTGLALLAALDSAGEEAEDPLLSLT